MRKRRAAIAGVLLAAALPVVGGAPSRAQDPVERPNVLIIVTDDQRAQDTMEVMPHTVDYFSEGVTFSQAIATTPVCCPSRASIMTGRYAHNHNVRSNAASEADRLDQETTLQRDLRQAGYHTGIAGKYLNGWDIGRRPLHFDEFAIMRTGYYKTRFGVGRKGRQTVKRLSGYSTNFIRRWAERFIRRREKDDSRPWMLYVTPFAPHGPSIAPPRYQDAEVPPFYPNPAMLEEDTSDKPPQYAQYVKPFDPAEHESRRARQLRSLMPVDDLVRQLTDRLEAEGETNTIVFFMSDNGYMWGEHGLVAKATAYDQSLRIPMMMRWDGRVTPATDGRLAANIDVAPTVYEATGVAPGHTLDGRSLLQQWDRDAILAEVYGAISRPELRWAALIGHEYGYVEYYGGDETVPVFREYYDRTNDPWQLDNLFGDGDPMNDPNVVDLTRRLVGYRHCPTLEACP